MQFGKVENYPRRHLADYDARHPGEEAKVISTVWGMEPADIAAVKAELGKGILTEDTLSIHKTYEQDGTTWTLSIAEDKGLENLIQRFALAKKNARVLARPRRLKTRQKRCKPAQQFARAVSSALTPSRSVCKTTGEIGSGETLLVHLFTCFQRY